MHWVAQACQFDRCDTLFRQGVAMTILDKSTLSHLYLEEQLTIRAIAEKLDVNPRKIHDAMRLWHIPRRSNSTRLNRPAPIFPFDEATLRYHYHGLGQTIKQIAEHFN